MYPHRGGNGVAPTSAASKAKVFVRLYKKNVRNTAGKLLKLRHTASSEAVTGLVKVKEKKK